MNATLTTAVVATALTLIRRNAGSTPINADRRTAWEAHGLVVDAIPAMLDAELLAIDGDDYRITATAVDMLDAADLLTSADLADIDAGTVEVATVD